MAVLDIPAGFAPHFRSSPLTKPWEPLYSRAEGEAVIIGLRAGEPHTNSRGFVHGGLITALADVAMGLSCSRRLGDMPSLVTVNLNVDFLGAALTGQWLEFTTEFVRPGSTLCFTQCFVTADGQPCARANAVFRVVKRRPE
ncbi:PaaI family thioesterase [Phenylobacterium sp. J426]|uniref:PaaI family thioesterase n=1 Tax=Phenylobacterium sp. J426 TaxID=2898439 RepID=UPI002150B689|nr:PaaI family thioesterase [Phenylobacterium sp. J426]MCR5876016.1 PaaI family thioesterase [Phenylobacterium sp. J426]